MTSTSSSAAFNFSQQGIPMFVGEKYDIWSMMMKTLFISQDLWEFVEEGYETANASPEIKAAWTAPQRKQHKENAMKDAKALSFIQQGVSQSILPRIMGVTTSHEAWEILRKQYGGHDKVIMFNIKKRYNLHLFVLSSVSISIFIHQCDCSSTPLIL